MNLAVITTSRADWGALGMVAKALRQASEGVAVLAAAHHSGLHSVREDGFEPQVFDCWLTMSSAVAALTAMKPRCAVVLGDRWETVLVALACKYVGVPLAHLGGGDISLGSSDHCYRNAISDLADLHFPTNVDAEAKLTNVAGYPGVFMCGSAAIDRILATKWLSRQELGRAIGISDDKGFILGNWQPVADHCKGLNAIFDAIRLRFPGMEVVWATPGADPGQDEVSETIKRRSGRDPIAMSPAVYLSAMKRALCIIGNSSSGIYEAAAVGTPAVNVGQRQEGRLASSAVRNVAANAEDICTALEWVVQAKGNWWKAGEPMTHPYGDGHAAEKIAMKILSHV